jgi:hypothetical protein
MQNPNYSKNHKSNHTRPLQNFSDKKSISTKSLPKSSHTQYSPHQTSNLINNKQRQKLLRSCNNTIDKIRSVENLQQHVFLCAQKEGAQKSETPNSERLRRREDV